MSIKIAKTAGFCYGVKRAVSEAYRLAENPGNYVTLGEIIHNSFVVDDLAKKGIRAYENVRDIPEGASVIIRTHGVPKAVLEEIRNKGLEVIDLTCPFVSKIHRIVYEKTVAACYVATAVYGSYDCPEVWILRRYRDYTLAETWYGRAFIHTYYAISPTLVKWFGHT